MKLKFSTTQLVMLTFALAIIVGTCLLMLPISTKSGVVTSFEDALFTATTSTCVTGLVVLPTFSHWSFFGQTVILFLIQIGGLGIITVMSAIMLTLKKRLGLGDSVIIKDSFNLNTLSGISRFVKKVVLFTLFFEGAGMLVYLTVFVPEFGVRGIWYSLFNSVSAFCNAGLDVIGENSLMNYLTDPVINLTTSILIVAGGIGYTVWFDIYDTFKKKRGVRYLTLHSKIALSTTAILLLFSTVLFFIFEYNGTALKGLGFFEKLQACFFQSVTTRTAGFATVDQALITDSSAFLSLFLMLVGGSPVGTAGGIKTVTLAVLVFAGLSAVKNEESTTVFSRTVPSETVKKAIAVTLMSLSTVFISTLLLLTFTDAPLLDVIYETVSATATVGLTRNLTPTLGLWGKVIIIFTMYIGRIGPISLALAFKTKKQKIRSVKFPSEKISVG